MYLTISKRFEFSSSHRLAVSGWSDEQNQAFFGREAEGRLGHGHNYEAFFAFNGPVDEPSGMMINVTIIKEKIKALIDSRYDHKYLNADTPPFDKVIPTAENVAQHLFDEAAELFAGQPARPVVCHLAQSPETEATVYADGRVERHYWIDFSAARRTYSPHLTEAENRALFGMASAPSGHGHHYRLRVTLAGKIHPEYGMVCSEKDAWAVLRRLQEKFDHRHLNIDVSELKGKPMTSEMMTNFFWHYLKNKLPVVRLRLYEHDRFFVECEAGIVYRMGVISQFNAAHRLHSAGFSDDRNRAIYARCNNPAGHGHLYQVEVTIADELDEKTGIIYGLDQLCGQVDDALAGWHYKHLDLETDEFKKKPSTGENIVTALWAKLENPLGVRLYRVRLWETPNNRFALRRGI